MVAGAGRPGAGFHQLGRWDRLIAVDHCHIVSDTANDVRRAFELWAREHGLEAHNQRSGGGWLRHLVVREGAATGELLAMLVTAPGDDVPAVDRLAQLLPAGVVGVVHAVNPGVAEVTGGLEHSVLYGRDWFSERIGGLEFEVSPGAFMQTNTVMAERLYAIAIEFADLRPDDVVWDLYCGAGAIGLLAARRAGRVYGIEISPESIAGARRNAERNGIANVEFLEGDAAKSVRPLLERAPRPDVVFVDPPRSGLTPEDRPARARAPTRAARLRLLQPDDACPQCAPAGRRRLHARASAAARHVPAHAAHRVRRPAAPLTGGTQNSRATASITSAHAATDAMSTHSSVACAPAPDGPKTTVGMPGRREHGRVHPGAVADDGRLVAEHRARVAANGGDDARARVDLERRPLEGRAHRRVAGQVAHLRVRPAPASRRGSCAAPPRAGSGRDSSRARGRPRSARRGSIPARAAGATAGRELAVRAGRAAQDAAHGGDRVDAEVGPRPVRGHALVSISSHRNPLCATQTCRPVGSVTIAASARPRRRSPRCRCWRTPRRTHRSRSRRRAGRRRRPGPRRA